MEKHKACKYLQILYNNVEKQKSSDVQSNKCFLCVKNQLFQMFASHLTRFAWMKRWTSINTETCSKVLVHDADVFRGRLSITFRHQTLRRPAHSRLLESNRSGPQRTVPFQWCSAGSDERTSCCDAIQVPCWWGGFATSRTRVTVLLYFAHLGRCTATCGDAERLRAGVPNLSLTMYPFSISTDEHVPLKCLSMS